MNAPWRNDRIKQVYGRPEIKASLEIIMSIFAVTGLLTLAIRPTLATVATLQKKIEDQSVVDRKLNTKIAQLAKANTDLGTYADRVPDYLAAVTDTHDESGLAKRIELLARENNVTINGLSLNAVPLIGEQINLSGKEGGAGVPETETGGKVASFVVNFYVSGSQAAVFAFLSELENTDRVVLISVVDFKKEEIKSVGTKQGISSLRAIGKANVYYILGEQGQ